MRISRGKIFYIMIEPLSYIHLIPSLILNNIFVVWIADEVLEDFEIKPNAIDVDEILGIVLHSVTNKRI